MTFIKVQKYFGTFFAICKNFTANHYIGLKRPYSSQALTSSIILIIKDIYLKSKSMYEISGPYYNGLSVAFEIPKLGHFIPL